MQFPSISSLCNGACAGLQWTRNAACALPSHLSEAVRSIPSFSGRILGQLRALPRHAWNARPRTPAQYGMAVLALGATYGVYRVACAVWTHYRKPGTPPGGGGNPPPSDSSTRRRSPSSFGDPIGEIPLPTRGAQPL